MVCQQIAITNLGLLLQFYYYKILVLMVMYLLSFFTLSIIVTVTYSALQTFTMMCKESNLNAIAYKKSCNLLICLGTFFCFD